MESETRVNYQEWMKTVPGEITQDPLWGLEVYRLGFFIADITWDDTEALFKNHLLTVLQTKFVVLLMASAQTLLKDTPAPLAKTAPVILNMPSAKLAKRETAFTKFDMQ